jgi:membrane protein YqaA with SNARE-associated domain
MVPFFRRQIARLSRRADSPLFPGLGMVLAFAATLTAVAFVPILCALVAARRRHWVWTAICCAIGSALGATLLAWLAGEYGMQFMTEVLPRVARSQEWGIGMRWVKQFGFIALIAVACLPLSQTPVLIACALLGMPAEEVFASVLVGKLIKYIISAALATAALNHVADHGQDDVSADKKHGNKLR